MSCFCGPEELKEEDELSVQGGCAISVWCCLVCVRFFKRLFMVWPDCWNGRKSLSRVIHEPIHGGCFEILKNKQNPKLNGVYSKILSPASPPTPHAAAQHLCSGSGNSSAFFCPQSFPLFVKGFEMLGWGKSCSLLIADVNKEPDGPCRP